MKPSVVPALRRALHTGIAALFPAPVGVFLGEPGPEYPDDMIAVLGARTTLDKPVHSPARPREETSSIEVAYSVYRSGEDAQATATDRVFAMASEVEQWIRSGALELPTSALVREIAVTEYELREAAVYGNDQVIAGRVSELHVTVVAKTRI